MREQVGLNSTAPTTPIHGVSVMVASFQICMAALRACRAGWSAPLRGAGARKARSRVQRRPTKVEWAGECHGLRAGSACARRCNSGQRRREDTWGEAFRALGTLGELEQVELLCAGDRLGAAAHRQLTEEMVDMRFHRTDGDDQRLGDLRIGATSRDQAQHLQLALGEWLDQILDFGFWIYDLVLTF